MALTLACMRRTAARSPLAVLASCAFAVTAGAQAPREFFRVGRDCSLCHSLAPGANALRSAIGEDISPHGLWQATMMANAYRDPFFLAQVEMETAGDESAQQQCLRCHAPMAHHHRVMNKQPAPGLADVVDDELAHDGVSCTVCHQITAEGLGEERTFSGNPVLGRNRTIFGPYPDPETGPMRGVVGYTPTQGLHTRDAGLCATCHTLVTEHQGVAFPEQTPYFEWRNSDFGDVDGGSETTRTCQECHMADVGSTRLARNPMGRDFLIQVRDGFRAHGFVGGSAFMLDMMRVHRDELGVEAGVDELARLAAATRKQLGEATAAIAVQELDREGSVVSFTIRVENKTGHKFPTGIPSRRAWLHVQVRSGRKVVFESGGFDAEGRILAVGRELGLPHVVLVERPEDVPIYELVAHDADGRPTTHLTRMAGKLKDTRLLPRGWRRDGPHPEETAPVGTGKDFDFVAGGDTVAYRIALPEGANGPVQVVAWLHYQTVPPEWVDALRATDGEAARRFVRLYDAADKQPETVAVTVASETAGR